MNGTRMASGSTGNCPAQLIERPPTPANSRGATATSVTFVSSMAETMAHLLGQANAWIDVGVEDVDDQIGRDEHGPGFHVDGLDEREFALQEPLVQKPADAGPGKDCRDE